jgi:serine/threonine protein kinase
MNCHKPLFIEVSDLHKYYIYDDNDSSEDLIGFGSSAYVYKAINQRSNKTCAIKVQPKLDSEDIKNDSEYIDMYKLSSKFMQTEIVIGEYIKKLGLSKYVITPNAYYHMQHDDGIDYYAIEYDYIISVPFNKIPKTVSKDIILSNMYILYNVILILHKNGLYHNDIHPDNVLFDTINNRFVLIDLGLSCSKICKSQELAHCHSLGALDYIKPSLLNVSDELITYKDREQNDIYGLTLLYDKFFHSLFKPKSKFDISKLEKLCPNYGLIESALLWLSYLDDNDLNKIQSILNEQIYLFIYLMS